MTGCSLSSGLCGPGSYSTAGSGVNASCSLCPAGTYSVGNGSAAESACLACPAGSYCLAGCSSSSGSGLCGPGSYSTAGSGVNASCSPCAGGRYCLVGCGDSNGSGVCAAGSYSLTGGGTSPSCTECPAGLFCFAGCASYSGSGACPLGKYSTLGSKTSAACVLCPECQVTGPAVVRISNTIRSAAMVNMSISVKTNTTIPPNGTILIALSGAGMSVNNGALSFTSPSSGASGTASISGSQVLTVTLAGGSFSAGSVIAFSFLVTNPLLIQDSQRNVYCGISDADGVIQGFSA